MVDLLPNDDQTAIIDSVRAYLQSEMPVTRLRQALLATTAQEAQRWREMVELGWLSSAEDDGEDGLDFAAEALMFREFGRHLLTPSLLATVIAAHMAKALGKSEMVERFTNGALHCALAYPAAGKAGNDHHRVDAREGSYTLVWDEGGLALLAPGDVNVVEHLKSFDPTVRLEKVTLADGAKSFRSDDPTLIARARILSAALLLGAAEETTSLATEYAKMRHQFGRAIGSFQAIQHKCADMVSRADNASAQVVLAALYVQEGLEQADFQAAAALFSALESAVLNAGSSIQIHGGIGFTFETESHFYLKRAHLLGSLGGGRWALQRELIAAPSPYQA